MRKCGRKIAQTPTEGKWFEVKPLTINRNLFFEERADAKQENTRKIILEAFAEVDANLEKFGRDFRTMKPKKTWPSYKTVDQLEELADNMGDHMADWVEQCLEWAQRISNGEPWKTVCNDADTSNWYRLIRWKDGYRIVGGARKNYDSDPASNVNSETFLQFARFSCTVPLIVEYETSIP